MSGLGYIYNTCELDTLIVDSDIFMGFVKDKENIEYDQPYPALCGALHNDIEMITGCKIPCNTL